MEKSYEQKRIFGALNILKDLNAKIVGLSIVCIWRLFTYTNTNYYIFLIIYLLLILYSINYLFQHWINKSLDWERYGRELKISPLKDIFISISFLSFNLFLLYLGLYKGLWKAIEPMFNSEIDFSWLSFAYRLTILLFGIYAGKDFNNVQGLIASRNLDFDSLKKYME